MLDRPVRWGVLGSARIARQEVIPALGILPLQSWLHSKISDSRSTHRTTRERERTFLLNKSRESAYLADLANVAKSALV